MGDAEWALLQHGFVWHPDVFAIATKAVSYLGLFDYVAMHARYGEFEEHKARRGSNVLFQSWGAYLQPGTWPLHGAMNHSPNRRSKISFKS